jgi:hypothetical protein
LTFLKCSTSSTFINASINQHFSNMSSPLSNELYWRSYKSKNTSSTFLTLKYTYLINVQKTNWFPFTTTSRWKHTTGGTTLNKKMFFFLLHFGDNFLKNYLAF